MHKHLVSVGAGAAIIAFVIGHSYLATPHPDYDPTLTFSRTALWDPIQDARSKEPLRYPEALFADITLPPPPRNDSPETAHELALLKSYQGLRTLSELRDINEEINLETMYFAQHSVEDYMDDAQYPHTAALLRDSFHDVTVLLLRQKRLFDRVRPNVLDPGLTTAIPVPGHPAYPSGHATQTHFLALLFSALDPAHEAYYQSRAEQIAHNREIAGLHYPSDSRAGDKLAVQVFAALKKDARFTKLLAAAQEEWRVMPPAQALTTE